MAKKKKRKKPVFCLIPEGAGRIHALLTLESHSADGLWTLEPVSGQGTVSRTAVRLRQASEYSWASAAVMCFWLQFHTSWQMVCVKISADSGCERYTAGEGCVWWGGWENRAAQSQPKLPEAIWSLIRQRKDFMHEWFGGFSEGHSLLWALLLVGNGRCWASLSSQP